MTTGLCKFGAWFHKTRVNFTEVLLLFPLYKKKKILFSAGVCTTSSINTHGYLRLTLDIQLMYYILPSVFLFAICYYIEHHLFTLKKWNQFTRRFHSCSMSGVDQSKWFGHGVFGFYARVDFGLIC